ncbi:deoxyribonuclease-1-like isoform X2 [Babylonia areolata]
MGVTCTTVLGVVCILGTLTTIAQGLRVGAFNAKVFGVTKAGKPHVMDVLAKIAARYDILLLQEIKDSSGQAILQLLQRIKQDHGITMSMNISERLGRTSSKEQYAFMYRQDRGLSVVDSLHFDDGDEATEEDLFQREPYIVRFQASQCVVPDFSLVALHTMPTQTVEELKALPQVVQHVKDVWDTDNVLVLGDLNADCRYVPKRDWPHIAIRHDDDFWWAIGDDEDTTVSNNTDCAYDRFIVAGKTLRDAVINETVQVFDFQTQYGLSSDQALEVSDHFPIELTLRDKDTNSRGASGAVSMVQLVKRAWQAVVKKLSRWRANSDL